MTTRLAGTRCRFTASSRIAVFHTNTRSGMTWIVPFVVRLSQLGSAYTLGMFKARAPLTYSSSVERPCTYGDATTRSGFIPCSQSITNLLGGTIGSSLRSSAWRGSFARKRATPGLFSSAHADLEKYLPHRYAIFGEGCPGRK